MIAILILKRIVLSAILGWLGIYLLRNTTRIMQMFGIEELAAQFWGGGSVMFWKIAGIVLVIMAILALGGTFSFVGF